MREFFKKPQVQINVLAFTCLLLLGRLVVDEIRLQRLEAHKDQRIVDLKEVAANIVASEKTAKAQADEIMRVKAYLNRLDMAAGKAFNILDKRIQHIENFLEGSKRVSIE